MSDLAYIISRPLWRWCAIATLVLALVGLALIGDGSVPAW